MIDLIAAAGIGGIIGFGVCAVFTMAKVTDETTAVWLEGYNTGLLDSIADHETAQAAHTRCADALETARNRIERALAVETPKAAHGVRKMARLLRGEQG